MYDEPGADGQQTENATTNTSVQTNNPYNFKMSVEEIPEVRQ